ncbi:PREDICTED: uncharacterized protein LOC104741495 [Camelina sativa]|uniref:Uncharacterized protein LOC104741495 n=1 Tax=Camelina sativa TaxID=90675 RepID=A0ABM0VT05_CAMSA|nr:PREDICTED: uncharacterized protein LOC104741495 [Camelina sativa]
MKGNKKISSIFDVSASQEVYLQRCGFAVPGQPPPDSDPSVGVSQPPLNDGTASHPASSDDSETDSVIGSGFDEEVAVESEAIRFVSPVESTEEEENATDPTVEVAAEKLRDVSRDDERFGKKKLKIPLRDVVKAIVMNSKNTEEEEDEDKEIEKMSCVQILLQKGFKF